MDPSDKPSMNAAPPGGDSPARPPAEGVQIRSPLDALKSNPDAAPKAAPDRFDTGDRFDPKKRGSEDKVEESRKPSFVAAAVRPEISAMPERDRSTEQLEFRSKNDAAYTHHEQTIEALLAVAAALTSKSSFTTVNNFHGPANYTGSVHGDVSQSVGGVGGAAGVPAAPQVPRDWPGSAFDACKGNAHALAFLVATAVLQGESYIAINQCASDLSAAMITRRQQMHAGSRRSATSENVVDIESDIDPSRDVNSKFEAFGVIQNPDEHGVIGLKFVDPLGMQKVLSYAVTNLGAIYYWAEDFTSWLTRLGTHRSLAIRRRAGAAVAALAKHANELDSPYLEAWLAEPSGYGCDAIDGAFVVLLDTQLKTQVMNEMSRWADGGARGNGWFAVCHLAGYLTGAAHPSFTYGLLRRMLNSTREDDSSAREWAVRGLARIMGLAYSSPERLPDVVRCFENCASDAAKRRDRKARARVYEAAILAAKQDLDQLHPWELSRFEICVSDSAHSDVVAPLYRKLSTIGDGVNIQWRFLLREFYQRAVDRNWAFEREPFWVLCQSIFRSMESEDDRQNWRELLAGWAETARDKNPTVLPGAARLLDLITSGSSER